MASATLEEKLKWAGIAAQYSERLRNATIAYEVAYGECVAACLEAAKATGCGDAEAAFRWLSEERGNWLEAIEENSDRVWRGGDLLSKDIRASAISSHARVLDFETGAVLQDGLQD